MFQVFDESRGDAARDIISQTDRPVMVGSLLTSQTFYAANNYCSMTTPRLCAIYFVSFYSRVCKNFAITQKRRTQSSTSKEDNAANQTFKKVTNARIFLGRYGENFIDNL